jgi:hypothetical protein
MRPILPGLEQLGVLLRRFPDLLPERRLSHA